MSTETNQEVVLNTPATETIAAPEPTDTPAAGTENTEAASPKTFTEDELKAQLDAEAAKIRNKYERKIEKARIETETRARVMQEMSARPEPKEDEPRVEDFTDYSDYLKAAARYEVKQEIAEQKRADREQEEQRSQQSEQSRKAELEESLMEKGNTKYADFEEVASATGEYLKSKNLKFSQAMVGALLETENSHDIVHFLGTNLEEAGRIASLPAYAQAKEIGKLEEKLSTKKPIKTSNAPDPIKPIEGGKNLTKKLEEMTYEEMLEHDRKRGARYLN